MKKFKLSKLKEKTGVKFGTSGIRDASKALTDRVCYIYTKAFVNYLEKTNQLRPGDKIAVAGDLRKSTPRLLTAVAKTISDLGYRAINCGNIPTPAVTNFGLEKKIPSVMITGSHIPADRNGIKYQLSTREILKKEEADILNMTVEVDTSIFDSLGMFKKDYSNLIPMEDNEAFETYTKRYTSFYPENFLEEKKIGLYGHSAVSRDILFDMLTKFGASVVKLDFLDNFYPVDTEAFDSATVNKGKAWNKRYNLDAIISTDGDGDRPFMSDENGVWIRADSTGIPVAHFLGAEAIAIPISCNTSVDKTNYFKKVLRTKIGSPYVVEGMINLEKEGYKNVLGYEANGGFLVHSDIKVEERTLKSLPTRDASVVIFTLLYISKKENKPLSEIMNSLPQRYTASGSIKSFPRDKSLEILEEFAQSDENIKEILDGGFGNIKDVDKTDGIRITFTNEDIVHFRPSGNSPEFRCYCESSTTEKANELKEKSLEIMKEWN